MLTNLTNVLFVNVNNLIIGKFYTKADLGYYYQADKLKKLPVESVSGIFTKTSTPLLAKNQSDLNNLHKNYFRIYRLAALIIIPIVVLLFIIGNDLIILLFTEKWSDSVPIFRILLIGGIFFPFIVINGLSPTIMGDTKFYLKMDTFYKIFRVITIAVALNFGLMIFIASQSFFRIIQMIGNAFIAKKFFKITLLSQVKILFPYTIYSIFSGILSFYIGYLVTTIRLIRIGSVSLVFLSLFSLFIFILERKTYNEVKNMALAGVRKIISY
jgi:O-antigen/teichoic acid export membrane protein